MQIKSSISMLATSQSSISAANISINTQFIGSYIQRAPAARAKNAANNIRTIKNSFICIKVYSAAFIYL